MFCARINPTTLKEQSVEEHLTNVSMMSMEYSSKISLEATGELIGVLHDMGKGTDAFNSYIHYCSLNPKDKSLKGSINHSTAGAKYIYDKFNNTTDQYQKLTAELISLAICSHHGGLIDCLDLEGKDRFTDKMHTSKEIYYDQALLNFKDCFDIDRIDKLFYKSKEEIKIALNKINSIDSSERFGRFAIGVLEKYLFSCVIDADRYDASMEGQEPKQNIDKTPLWNELSDTLENKINRYEKSSKIDKLRNEVSILCKKFAHHDTGI